jgi:hypothetical protein
LSGDCRRCLCDSVLVFPDEQTPLSLKVLDRLNAGEEALVPAFWLVEVLNSFMRLRRFGLGCAHRAGQPAVVFGPALLGGTPRESRHVDHSAFEGPMDPGTEERRTAIEAIATVAHMKNALAD